jgi:hypothetical protein
MKGMKKVHREHCKAEREKVRRKERQSDIDRGRSMRTGVGMAAAGSESSSCVAGVVGRPRRRWWSW